MENDERGRSGCHLTPDERRNKGRMILEDVKRVLAERRQAENDRTKTNMHMSIGESVT